MENIIEYSNIKDLIINKVRENGEKILYVKKFLKDKKETYENISYNKFLEDVNSFGASLYNLNLKGERIAIVGRNRYEWAMAHITNLLGGIVSIPLDKELKIDELENSIRRSKAKAIVFDEKYLSLIEDIKKRNNTIIKEYICMSECVGYKDVNKLITEGKDLIKSGKKEYINCKINPDAMSILLFTSGTTSNSKAVMLSQRNIASNIYAMGLHEKFYEDDVNIAFLPYHHIFGSTAMIVMIAFGVKTVFTDGLRYIAKNFKEYGVSVFVGVPLILEAIYKNVWDTIRKQGKEKITKVMIKISNFLLLLHIDIRRKIFKPIIDGLGGKMRFIISGGAPLDKNIEDGFRNMGIEVAQGYGLTETSPVIAAETYFLKKSGSVGIAMPNVTVEIFDKDEKGIGEIRVKGPNVMLGYYEDEEKTNEVLKDGWFYTGDLGYMDKKGILYITGRKKDMIVLKNGKKVFPEEIETLVNRLDMVKECMVFGMPDKLDANDVQVAVKVVYDEDKRKEKYKDLNDNEFYNYVWEAIKEINKTFPTYKYIKHLILTNEELIKTTTKKIKRQEEIKKILENSIN